MILDIEKCKTRFGGSQDFLFVQLSNFVHQLVPRFLDQISRGLQSQNQSMIKDSLCELRQGADFICAEKLSIETQKALVDI